MIEYTERSKFVGNLRIGVTYFHEPYITPHIDIIREFQYEKKQGVSAPFWTLVIDLTEPEDAIFVRFAKNTKYEINRAVKQDNIVIETLDARQHFESFCAFFDEFAGTKNLEPIDRKEIDRLVAHNMFVVRMASYQNEPLVYHTYITANGRARLAQSASLFRESAENDFRSMVGRANRLLHWDDIRYFKTQGYKIYDLGGINKDTSNTETLAINKFKECFGGGEVMEYKSLIAVSAKGLLYLWAKKIAGKTL
ncbi:hypothetical protein FACS1894106_1620 [Spirochaetia bacterium]|nr:hypothetical protein FACS1894106_1620 [Spirochaetia bacterium]